MKCLYLSILRSPKEKSDYESEAKITILVAINLDGLFVIDGFYPNLVLTPYYVPPGICVAFGRPDLVKSHLDAYTKNPLEPSQWHGYLTILFQHASSQSDYVAFPMDLAWWKNSQPPYITRVAMENEQ